MSNKSLIPNPFRPGAGQLPPVLAGRTMEERHFRSILQQRVVSQNILVTGLRGYGKTVLLSHIKKLSQKQNWLWVGNDLSESSSLTEDRLALRIITDIAETIGGIVSRQNDAAFSSSILDDLDEDPQENLLECHEGRIFELLKRHYERAPGLPSDKLKAVLLRCSSLASKAGASGIILAYDEAQCLTDHARRNEFPMSMLIETISALQKRDGVCPFLLVLSGLPQVFSALIETRTYTERMFHVISLDRLSRRDTYRALYEPLSEHIPPLQVTDDLLDKVITVSGGYPYLVQFLGKELVDGMLANGGMLHPEQFPSSEVIGRLESGMFAARWNRLSDKQREFLGILATRDTKRSNEFSAKDAQRLARGNKSFSTSYANQMMQALCEKGMLYRVRHGRYAFTVPLAETMILSRIRSEEEVELSWMLDDRSYGGAKKSSRWSWFR